MKPPLTLPPRCVVATPNIRTVRVLHLRYEHRGMSVTGKLLAWSQTWCGRARTLRAPLPHEEQLPICGVCLRAAVAYSPWRKPQPEQPA